MDNCRLGCVCAALFLAGCANVVLPEGETMTVGDGRLLDQIDAKKLLLGQKLTLDAAPVTGVEAGTGQATRVFSGWRVSAGVESSPEDFTFMIDAFPTTVWLAGAPGYTLLYARLQWGSGNAQHGTDTTTTIPGVPSLNSQILVDIGSGTSVSLAGNFFQVDFLSRSFQNLPGFALGVVPSAQYQVMGSLAYEPKVNVTRPTCTLPMLSLGAEPRVIAPTASSRVLFRPMYAKEVDFVWTEYAQNGATPPTTPLLIEFFPLVGPFVIAAYQIAANTLPPPRIPWPSEAQLFRARNVDAANSMTDLMARNYLDL